MTQDPFQDIAKKLQGLSDEFIAGTRAQMKKIASQENLTRLVGSDSTKRAQIENATLRDGLLGDIDTLSDLFLKSRSSQQNYRLREEEAYQSSLDPNKGEWDWDRSEEEGYTKHYWGLQMLKFRISLANLETYQEWFREAKANLTTHQEELAKLESIKKGVAEQVQHFDQNLAAIQRQYDAIFGAVQEAMSRIDEQEIPLADKAEIEAQRAKRNAFLVQYA
jgi:hypothetical protein